MHPRLPSFFQALSLLKKTLYVLLVLACLGTWGSWTYLDQHYARNRLEVPQPEFGRVYNLKALGLTKYITKSERLQLELLVWGWAGSVLALVILVGCETSWRRSRRP